MESTRMLPVLALLTLAVIVVILLLRFMRNRHPRDDRRAEASPPKEPAPAPLSKEEADYLDSSHISGPIVPGGRDALDSWQSNKRK